MESDSHPAPKKFNRDHDTMPYLRPRASTDNMRLAFPLPVATGARSTDTLPLSHDSRSDITAGITPVNLSTLRELGPELISSVPHNLAGGCATPVNRGGVVPELKLESTKTTEDGGAAITNATFNYAIPVEANQHALDNMASEQEPSEILAQMANIEDHNLDKSASLKFQRYITDLRLYCTTEGANFLPLDTVKLVVFGLENVEGDILDLEKESRYGWKQASVAEIPADADGLTVVATSADSADFAHVSLTKDELGSSNGTHEMRIIKDFTSEPGVPALQLSFVIIGIPKEEVKSEYTNDAEMVHIAQELGIRGTALLQDFQQVGNLADISEAITILGQAIQLCPNGGQNMPAMLNNLGVSFESRFARLGDLSDLSEAISAMQRAIQLAPNDHPDRPSWLSNLGVLFQSRFAHMGNLSDLSEAISVIQQAIQLTPNGHPNMSVMLSNIGNSFQSRFARMGDLSDLSEAISAKQRAVQLAPVGHPYMPAMLNNLGNSFKSRFTRMGDLSDLTEAISAIQQAVQITPNGHPDMPGRLNNLGVSLESRFARLGDLSDLSEAISAKQRAVQLTPNGDPYMPSRLTNLGVSFQSRFARMGDISDISEAVSASQRAVQLTPNGHPDMPTMLNNLGVLFESRFARTEDLSDVSEAISAKQRAIQLTPNGHPDMPTWLRNLGNSFLSRFRHTQDSSDCNTAIKHYKMSATTLGPPSARLNAAQLWAQLTTNLDHPAAMEAYAVAIDLISQIAGMDRTVENRHTNLVDISSLTTTAASVAFGRGELEKALEWLEQGRCLVWTQLNQLRTPVDDLHAHDASLAKRFLEISSALESSGSRRGLGALGLDAPMSQKMILQDEARIHTNLASEWKKVLDEIRDIPQFRNFLRPPQASELLRHIPLDGPIILINTDKSRCDALALISGCPEPIHIPLTDFTYEQASQLTNRLGNFLSWNGVRVREENRALRPAPARRIESDIHFVLGVLWLKVVRPILEGLSYSSPTSWDPRRIWWCPTGPLAFLPLHAAGIYGKARDEQSPAGSCISDFAVSSYIPTVQSLLRIIHGPINVQPPTSDELLIISQPNTPGCSPIKCTTKEMATIWTIMEENDCKSLRLEGGVATISRVQLEMGSHSSIHFACHASQDVENPLRSGFYLHDGRLELTEIMKQKITNCKLAFLSACQTSTGDKKLSEEAVHLAAGMLAVGYRSVVATMWSIKDQYGPVIAEGFYKSLMEKGTTSGRPGIDSANAARALHRAIRNIRREVGDTEQGLLTWVPYVHFGY